MKKVLVICLVMLMVAILGVTAFAAPNGFVSSPSGNAAPDVESFEPSDEDCTATLVVTPYGDKHELSKTLQAMLDAAYNSIVNADDLTSLNDDLAKIVKDRNLDSKKLAVSDLFDIHVAGCDYHEEHVDFDVTLSADTLSHFVALLHMNKDGEWELVADARVANNDEHLIFSVESFSPFAIVIDTSASSPDTGDSAMIYVGAMAASAVAFVVLLVVINRKKKENK